MSCLVTINYIPFAKQAPVRTWPDTASRRGFLTPEAVSERSYPYPKGSYIEQGQGWTVREPNCVLHHGSRHLGIPAWSFPDHWETWPTIVNSRQNRQADSTIPSAVPDLVRRSLVVSRKTLPRKGIGLWPRVCRYAENQPRESGDDDLASGRAEPAHQETG